MLSSRRKTASQPASSHRRWCSRRTPRTNQCRRQTCNSYQNNHPMCQNDHSVCPQTPKQERRQWPPRPLWCWRSPTCPRCSAELYQFEQHLQLYGSCMDALTREVKLPQTSTTEHVSPTAEVPGANCAVPPGIAAAWGVGGWHAHPRQVACSPLVKQKWQNRISRNTIATFYDIGREEPTP